jgi:uncharacterized membrane protein
MTPYTMHLYLGAFLIGVVAGLRTLTAPAAVSWAASLGVFRLEGTRLAFLGSGTTRWILTALAIVELVVDQLPSTPSRKTPVQFGARLASGALCGAAVATAEGSWAIGLAFGVLGAIVGTFAGHGVRVTLAHVFHRDQAAALLEDVVAIGGAALIVGVIG